MRRAKVLIIWMLMMLAGYPSFSDEVSIIDSLKNELEASSHDTTRIFLCTHISEKYQDTGIDIDSAMYYAKKAINIAGKNLDKNADSDYFDETEKYYIKYEAKAYYVFGYCYLDEGNFSEAISQFEEAIALCESIDSKEGIAENYTPLGIIEYAMGNYDGAIDYFQKGLDIFIEIEDSISIASAYNNIGIIYRNRGLYDKAMENYIYSLKVYEKAGNKRGEASANLNIGIIQNEQENYELALHYYLKALELFEEINAKRELNRLYNNIGLVYNNMAIDMEVKHDEENETDEKEIESLKKNYYDKALEYFDNSLSLATEMNDKYAMSANFMNIGSIYKDLKLYSKALSPFYEALKINKDIGDVAGQAMVYSNLSGLYVELYLELTDKDDEETEQLRKDYLENAISYGKRSLSIALDIGSLPTQRTAAKSLLDAYKNFGDSGKALEFAELFINVNQQIFNEERTRALTEMQTKYEAEKKELKIENLNQENALRKAELAQSEEQRKRQLVIIYAFVVGFIIIAVFSFLLLRLFIQKKKANILLASQKQQIEQKNDMLEEANEEIRSQKEEIEVQHDTVVKQKDFIEKQKTRIEDSIRYAKRIQNAMLPTNEDIKPLVDDYFILFQPKDVVSGDFYWATSESDWSIMVAADCTGHGVPGAFMSMLGISFLNQIISKKGFSNAARVLAELRELIIKALKQTYDEDSQVDGMDISLLAINKKTLTCNWAGAHNPLWIIKKDNINKAFDDIIDKVDVIKGDKMPVSLHVRMDNYTNHKISLNKGDKIYMFSDGYSDQFGGEKGRKINSKGFKKIIAEISHLPMEQQKSMLEEKLENWKNPENGRHFEQIDDVVVFGIEV